MTIQGLIPATLTPFLPDGSIDHDALATHIATVGCASRLYGIAVNGHAGEILALEADERQAVVDTARKALPSGLKLIAGIESHAVEGLVRQGLMAREAGADMLLVVPPFDVRVYRHLSHQSDAVFHVFRELDRRVGLPMIVFQYPEPSGCSYSLDALERIAALDHVVAIKASSGSPAKYAELHDRMADKLALLPAADSPSLLGMLLHGAPGSLIGISVVATQQWSDLVYEATQGDARRAKELHNRFAVPLMRGIFEYHMHWTATCPFAATKEALVQLGQFPPPGCAIRACRSTVSVRRRFAALCYRPA
jgi:4-hydroxy-tetrahydrodipicolinate synthase